MSIPFSGTLKSSGGLTAAIYKQVKSVTLKPLNRIVIKFDPFHEKIEQTRYFMYHISAPKVLKTNLNCRIKTQILCDRSDPTINFTLANGEEIEFKTANLSALEMLTLFNKHISILVPKEDLTATSIATKFTKKKAFGKKGLK
ncbi:mitochondrial ribosomal protein L53 [Rhodnius prolixus]|uniref:Large ribosomal subunit protein mL53 n=2 Tax=Rhodnius TaxID=13248 RepID=A0A4P6DC52_RHOPR